MKAASMPSRLFESIRGVRLYRDDLERVVGLIRGANLDVRIADGAFEYDSLDELRKTRGARPAGFSISGRRDDDRFEIVALVKSNDSWYVSADGHDLLALGREVERIVLARQTVVAHWPLYAVAQVSILGGGFGAALLTGSALRVWVLLAGVTGLAVSVLLGIYYRTRGSAVLDYPHEAGFLKRNRDQVGLLLVGASLGVAGTLVAQWVSTRIGPPTP